LRGSSCACQPPTRREWRTESGGRQACSFVSHARAGRSGEGQEALGQEAHRAAAAAGIGTKGRQDGSGGPMVPRAVLLVGGGGDEVGEASSQKVRSRALGSRSARSTRSSRTSLVKR